jgi:enoyl-CoA hydratase/carnithine racemase
MAYANKLASGPTLAIGHIKRCVHQGLNMPLAEGLTLERDLIAELFETEDATEGITAFAEKRKATFTGR